MSGNTSNMQSFRIDNTKNEQGISDEPDSPDIFINKMKSTISKKKKNNYKNIEELENIYEISSEPEPKKNKKSVSDNDDDDDDAFDNTIVKIKSSLEKFQTGVDSFKNMWNNIVGKSPKTKSTTKYNENSTSKTNKKGDKSTSKTTKKGDKSISKTSEEGFSNSSSNENVYTPEYEFDEDDTDPNLKKLVSLAKNGELSTTELKELRNSGKITDDQYNGLSALSLKWSGIDWTKTSPKTEDGPKCGPFEKNCGGSSQNIIEYGKQLIKYLKELLDLYSQVLTYISTLIYKSTDGKIQGPPSNSKADVDIIVDILHYLIMIPLSIWFAYNWFYITFYRDETDKPIKMNFTNKVMSCLKGLLIRFFKCLVQPMIILNAFICGVIPKGYYAVCNFFKVTSGETLDISFIGKILSNPIFIFIILTLIILFNTCKYSGIISNALYSYINDAKVPYEGYLHGIIAYDYIIGVASISILGMAASTISIIANPFMALFWFLVIVIFSHLAIRFAGIFMILYLYIMSYFALPIFDKGGVSAGIKSIKSAMKTSISNNENTCPKGKWEKIILTALNAIYENINIILYIIVLCYSSIWVLSDMKSASAKTILGTALALVAVILGMIIYISQYMKNKTSVQKGDIDI